MKTNIVFLLLFISTTIWSQDTFKVNLSITDTVITVKKSTNRKKYAAKVNVKINVPDLQDTLYLYWFKKYVSTSSFISDMNTFDNYKSSNIGLNYIVEDKNQHIMHAAQIIHGSYVNKRAEIRAMRTRSFVNSKLKIKGRVLNDIELRNYNLAKYEIVNEVQSLVL